MRPALALTAALLLAAPAPAQEAPPAKAAPKPEADKPSTTVHEIKVAGKPLRYTATAGTLPIAGDNGEPEAKVFYVAYTAEGAGDRATRPLMFSFNGGPGSSSVWLHLGAIGPRRVVMPDDATFAAPPFRLVDNESTWLDKCDLVFIDPVGTGYSRAAKPELNKKFHGLAGDVASVGEFIRLYMVRANRWQSPIYLVGESYGTTRAAGLANALVNQGIACNGVLLISSVLNFQTVEFSRGNDTPYPLFLPTYTAIAWYHKKLPPELQGDLKKTLDEVKAWATDAYPSALAKGDRLTPSERQEVVDRLARYTGLDRTFIDRSNLRVEIQRFAKELLRDRQRVVGRLDGRFQGIDANPGGELPEADPSMSAIRPPYTSTFNDYIQRELEYKSDLPYYILGEGVGAWDWGLTGRTGYPDVSAALRDAFAKNPTLKVFVGSGYYDLATPFAATEYTMAHMNLEPSMRRNFTVAEYESGHMMYIHGPSLAKLKADVAAFVDASSGR